MLPEKENLSGNLCCPMCGSYQTAFEGKVEGYRFDLCNCCEFTFCPEITDQSLAQLYSDGFHGPQDGAPKRGWSRFTYLEPALDLLSQNKPLHILDFGTGQSLDPEKLREEGHTVYAVDLVPPLRPHPHRLTGHLPDLKMDPDQFDLVYSFQVFEHLPHPRPILDELLRLTRPGGLVLIHTDMETPERIDRDFENWWYVLPPDHCSFYRHRTFETYVSLRPHSLIWKDEKRVIIQKEEVQ